MYLNKSYLPAVVALASLAFLTGCIDDKYDLANIDTTVGVSVNDLVVPVNLGPVTLNAIMDLDDPESSLSKEIGPDGQEVIVYNHEGDFHSDPINVNIFNVMAPSIASKSMTVSLLPAANSAQHRVAAKHNYTLEPKASSFSYVVNDLDTKITSVKKIQSESPFKISTTLSIPQNIKNNTNSIVLKNVTAQFPKGLYQLDGSAASASVGKYNPVSGILTIDSYSATSNTILIELTAQVMDFAGTNININGSNFTYSSSIDILGGNAELEYKSHITSVPSSFDVNLAYNVGNLKINQFSGKIDYDIEGLSFEKATLNDLPDFLMGDETMIKLDNPQLYLNINNYCAPYGLGGNTSLAITPIRSGISDTPLVMGSKIVVPNGVEVNTFAISPEGSALQPVSDYAGATKLEFAQLGNVLAGDGLPDEIEVEFTSPKVDGNAVDFPLGRDISSLNGSYLFRAPLALVDGSQIVYNGTRDDFDSEELEDLKVKRLVVEADAVSTIPLEVTLSAVLLDKDGNHMGVCSPTSIEALGSGKIRIEINPSANEDYISGIDGIYYTAAAYSSTPADHTSALSPDQSITLTNLRAIVSGEYVKYDEDFENDYK